jgi:signal transduction histidine kinase
MKKISFKEYSVLLLIFVLFGAIGKYVYTNDVEEIDTSFNETKIYFEQNASNLIEYGDLISLGVLVKMQKKLPVFVFDHAGSVITSNQKNILVDRPAVENKYGHLVSHKLPIYSNNKIAGEFVIIKPGPLSIYGSKYLLGFIMLALSVFILLLLILRTKEVNDIKLISRFVEKNVDISPSALYSSYINLLINSINGFKRDILGLSLELQKQKELEIRAEVTAQVAHDIRSPVAALSVLSSNLSGISDEDRLLLQMAVERINNIAEDLLQQNSQAMPADILNIVESIILEKRFELQDRPNIKMSLETRDMVDYISILNHGQFSRIISNLINNSLDSISYEGLIEIQLLAASVDHFQIKVIDNGKGIPQDVLAKLGSKGFSSGKKSGNGLGLFHAKKMLTNWGGDLTITSQVGQGTEVVITLPRLINASLIHTSFKLLPLNGV